MTSPKLQEDSKTMATDVFQLNPLNRVPSLASRCSKVLAANQETFMCLNNNKRVLKHCLTQDASQHLIEGMRNLSYLKATPLNNEFFSMFVDGNRSSLGRLDLRNCEIDDLMLHELLVVHGRNLASLNLSQGRPLTGAAIPDSIDLRNLHTLDLGDQLSLFCDWRPGDDLGRLITSACPDLCSLKIDMSKWNELFDGNQSSQNQSPQFLKDLLARIRPVRIEVAHWNHAEVIEVFNDHLIDNLQSLVLPAFNKPSVTSSLSSISRFKNLRSLDISRADYPHPYEVYPEPYNKPASSLFNLVQSLPFLEFLDISGTNLTAEATDDDPIPPGPYLVSSTISGLLGLHKPLKFLSIMSCYDVDDEALIPADKVASSRNVAESLVAMRHYRSRVRVLFRSVQDLEGVMAISHEPVIREFLDVVCNREVFASLSLMKKSYVDDVGASVVGCVIGRWFELYMAAPLEEKLDADEEAALFDELQRTALQLTELLLNSGNVIQYPAVLTFLYLSHQLLKVRKNEEYTKMQFNQFQRFIDQILASELPSVPLGNQWPPSSSVYDTVERTFQMILVLIQKGKQPFLQWIGQNSIVERMLSFVKTAATAMPKALYGIGVGEFPWVIYEFIRVFETLWDAEQSYWVAFIKFNGLEVLAQTMCLMKMNTTYDLIGYASRIRRYLDVLIDSSQPGSRRYAACVILTRILEHPTYDIRFLWLQDEIRSAIKSGMTDNFSVIQSRDVKEVITLDQLIDRVGMMEAPTIQLWAIWSILKLAESEPMRPVVRLYLALRHLINFNDAGFAVPADLLKMAEDLMSLVDIDD